MNEAEEITRAWCARKRCGGKRKIGTRGLVCPRMGMVMMRRLGESIMEAGGTYAMKMLVEVKTALEGACRLGYGGKRRHDDAHV